MSIEAEKLDDWYLDEPDCQVDIKTVVDGETSKLQWRNHWTLKMSRKFAMMTSFTSETKTVKTSFSGKVGPGSAMTWNNPGMKFACTQDNPVITDPITGEGIEYQTWEHYDDFEDIPDTTFTSVDS